jgi:ribosomal protein S18 acetylase RimI-like enzyme
MMDDADLVKAFEAQAIPLTEWNHRAHLRVAWNYVTRHPWEEALRRMREGILAQNAKNKIDDQLTMGYHETLTVAWLRLIAGTIRRYGACATSEDFLDEQTWLTQRKLLRAYYSKERLVTWEAKRTFVEPDLAPLPVLFEPYELGQVRTATSADIEAIRAVHTSLQTNSIAEGRILRALANGCVLVTCDAGEVVGYLAFDYNFFDRGFVDFLLVKPSHRRRGHGEALMRAAREICRTPVLFTSTNESNQPMQRLLEKLGYRCCGKVDNLDPGDPELFYCREKE